MFRPQIQKTRVMVSLAILVMAMVYWAVNSYERTPTYGFDIKKKTVDIMVDSIELLRSEFVSKGINSGADSMSFGSFLIGPGESIIKTTSGSLISKQSVAKLICKDAILPFPIIPFLWLIKKKAATASCIGLMASTGRLQLPLI